MSFYHGFFDELTKIAGEQSLEIAGKKFTFPSEAWKEVRKLRHKVRGVHDWKSKPGLQQILENPSRWSKGK